MILVYFWLSGYSTTTDGPDTKSLFNTLQTFFNKVQKRDSKNVDSKVLKTAPQLRSSLKKNLFLSFSMNILIKLLRTKWNIKPIKLNLLAMASEMLNLS